MNGNNLAYLFNEIRMLQNMYQESDNATERHTHRRVYNCKFFAKCVKVTELCKLKLITPVINKQKTIKLYAHNCASNVTTSLNINTTIYAEHLLDVYKRQKESRTKVCPNTIQSLVTFGEWWEN